MKLSLISTVFISVLLQLFILHDQSCSQPDEVAEYYTVQVASFPIADSVKAFDLYHQLKEKNYLVFLSKTWIKDRGRWLRVRIGYFDSNSGATRFALEFQEKENRDYYITKTKLEVASHSQGFRIIYTPSAIWYQDDNGVREVFDLSKSLTNTNIEADYATPSISPNGQYVLFEYDSHIYVFDLKTWNWRIIQSDVTNSLPQMSPSSKYVAYTDLNLWEAQGNLWLIDLTADNKTTCLVECRGTGNNTVKYFRWHPQKDIIIYVEGYAYGTVSVGGSIYSVDTAGNIRALIKPPAERTEIYSRFSISNDSLHYRVAHFDEQYMRSETTEHVVALEKLER